MEGLKMLQPVLADYELIDSGNGTKLERFGSRVVARPEPQAVWRRSLSDVEWEHLADATFSRSGAAGGFSGSGGGSGSGSSSGRAGSSGSGDERGQWILKSGMPDRWTMRYDYGEMHLRMRLAFTGFKHTGVFPEQAVNWNFIYDTLKGMAGGGGGARILNLFAYTGGATLAARAAGADVTHVDSVKQTVAWARDNMELSGFEDGSSNEGSCGRGSVRWIVDDALKFVRREVRRGSRYDGIVLDPPAYGRGPTGEKWVLEQGLDEMLSLCAELLKPRGFFVLNLYSMGLSAIVARSAVHRYFGEATFGGDFAGGPDFGLREQFGELYFADRAGKELPLGVYYRFTR